MTRDEWRLCEERFASRGIDMAAVSRGAAFFSTTQQEQIMPDPITRLRAARFDGPQALFTEAVRLLSERPALPDDLAGLVARLREPWFTNGCAAYQHEAADAIEALSAIPLRPEAEVRAEAWAAALELAAEEQRRKTDHWMKRAHEIGAGDGRHPADGRAAGHLSAEASIRAMITGDARAALDRIKAEAKAKGMREAARIAKSRAGSPDYEPPSPYDRGYAAAVAEVERAILAAIPEVRK